MFAVINHLHLKIPVDELTTSVEAEGAPLLASLPGFRGFHWVKEADDRVTVIILWEDGQAAQNGAQVFGPSWFAKHIAPNLASEQQRTAGVVVVSV